MEQAIYECHLEGKSPTQADTAWVISVQADSKEAAGPKAEKVASELRPDYKWNCFVVNGGVMKQVELPVVEVEAAPVEVEVAPVKEVEVAAPVAEAQG